VTGAGAPSPAADDWVGCLVLAVVPRMLRARVGEGVRRAEAQILGDPVLADTARVAMTVSTDPLESDLDDIADTLFRELCDWSLSPRNPALRTLFCLLVAHPDGREAGRLVRSLAATGTLSQLPIVFRVAPVGPGSDDAMVDDGADLERMILEAVDVAAREIEQTPGFWLTREQLHGLAVGGRARPKATPVGQLPASPPTPSPASSPAPVLVDPDDIDQTQPSGPAAWVPPAWAPPTAAPARVGGRHARHAEPDADGTAPPAGTRPSAEAPVDEQDDRASTDDEGDATVDGRRAARRSPLKRFVESTRSRFARRAVPASNVGVIEELSGRADRVSMLYIVMVSEPVRPSRHDRARRAEVALGLTQAVQTAPTAEGRGSWYVRAFTAARHLDAAAPLPGPDVVRKRDFPERWGEYFALYDCVGELLENIDRDGSSFVRRGTSRPKTFVVFLASKPPTVSADCDGRLTQLCRAATTVWVSFESPATQPVETSSDRPLHFLREHEDVVDQLRHIVLADDLAPHPPQRVNDR
jgi:hypothetical protein